MLRRQASGGKWIKVSGGSALSFVGPGQNVARSRTELRSKHWPYYRKAFSMPLLVVTFYFHRELPGGRFFKFAFPSQLYLLTHGRKSVPYVASLSDYQRRCFLVIKLLGVLGHTRLRNFVRRLDPLCVCVCAAGGLISDPNRSKLIRTVGGFNAIPAAGVG